MNEYKKPILGVAPSYIRAGARIKELAEAIARASDEAEFYPGHIEDWAREIIDQNHIIQKYYLNEFPRKEYLNGKQSKES